jgi:hypothetical protein
MPVYFLAFAGTMALISVPVAGLMAYRERKWRRRKVEKFSRQGIAIPFQYEWVMESYIKYGIRSVLEINHLINNPKELGNLMRPFQLFHTRRREFERLQRTAKMLERSAVNKTSSDEIAVDEMFRKFFGEFQLFLANTGTFGEMSDAEQLEPIFTPSDFAWLQGSIRHRIKSPSQGSQ